MMKRKIISIFLSLLIFSSVCSMLSVSASEKNISSFFDSRVNGFVADVGDIVTIDYYVQSQIKWEDFQGHVTYDSNGLQLVDYEMPDVGKNGANGVSYNTSIKGYVYYSGVNIDENYDFKDALFYRIKLKILKAGEYQVDNYFVVADNTRGEEIVRDNVINDISQLYTYEVVNVTTSKSPKKSQTITAKSYTKVYGSKAFNLGAKAKTKLNYSSNNKGVATVSSNGNVTIKGVGKATITIKAQETSTYKSSTKKITVKVNPRPITNITYSVVKDGVIKLKWNKIPEATCYKVDVSYNKNLHNCVANYITDNSCTFKGLKHHSVYINIKAVTNYDEYDFAYGKSKTIMALPYKQVPPVNIKTLKYKKNGSSLYFSWNKVSGAKGYKVKVNVISKSSSFNASKFVRKNKITLNNVKKGFKVKFSICTCKTVNNKSQYSAWKTKTFIVK